MTPEDFIREFDLLVGAPNGIPKLRELILQLAVRGKLVPQDPNDEPASELLKKIKAEKEKLIKEGKIRKPKPLAPIDSDEIPYELPEGWEWGRLGEIVEYGSSLKISSTNIPDDAWLLGLEDIEKNTSKILNKVKYAECCSKSTKAHFIKGDVLYGKLRPYLNKVVVAETEGYCTTEIIPLRQYLGLDPYYMLNVLKAPLFLKYVNSRTYGVKMPRLGTEDGRKALIPLPPIAEQKRIVARVDQLMDLCDELEEKQNKRGEDRIKLNRSCLNALTSPENGEGKSAWNRIRDNFNLLYDCPENVSELRKAILQLAVMGKLVPQDPNDEPASELLKKIKVEKEILIKEGIIRKQKPFPPIDHDEVPYELSNGWMWVRMGDAYDVRDGTHDTPKYVNSGFPLVTSKNIYGGKFDLANVKYISEADHRSICKRSAVDQLDILFAMIGSIGNPVIVDDKVEFSIKNVALFKYYKIDLASPKYLCNFLSHAAEDMRMKATGGVQNFVSLTYLRNYLIPLPPLAEQKRIVARVDQLMALCDELETKLNQSQSSAGSLIGAVVNEITAV